MDDLPSDQLAALITALVSGDADLDAIEGPLPAPAGWKPETPVEMLAAAVLEEHRNPESRLSTLWLDIVRHVLLRRYVAPVNDEPAAQSVYTFHPEDLPGDMVCQLFFGYDGASFVSFGPYTIGRASIGADGVIRDGGDYAIDMHPHLRMYAKASRCFGHDMDNAVPLYFVLAQAGEKAVDRDGGRPIRCATSWCDLARGDLYDSTQRPHRSRQAIEDRQMGRLHMFAPGRVEPLESYSHIEATYTTMEALVPNTPRTFGLDNHCNIVVCGTFQAPGSSGGLTGVCVLDRETRRATHIWPHPMLDPAQCHMEFTLRENHLVLTLPEDDGGARHHVCVFTRCGHLVRILATFDGVISFMYVHPNTGNLWVGVRRAPTLARKSVHEVVELLAIE